MTIDATLPSMPQPAKKIGFLGFSVATILIVATLQTLALAYIVMTRISLLANGREVVAEVIPVDPRDIFRGDYVILGYSFTRSGDAVVPAGTENGARVFVRLTEKAPTRWEIAAISSDYPNDVGANDVVLRAFAQNVFKGAVEGELKASLRYGIESYFVPEGTGLALEQQVREKKIMAVLSVGPKGEVALKALMVDGKRIAEEPLL